MADELREWCRAVMDREGREGLREAITDPGHKHHWKALELVVHYAYRNPTRAIGHGGADGGPVTLNVVYEGTPGRSCGPTVTLLVMTYFTGLKLEEWHQFHSMELQFHPRLTLLTGANASGKT